MRIECWLVTALYTIDDLPVAAFDNEGEAHDYCDSLEAMPPQAQQQVVYDAFAVSGLPDSSEFIRFVVRHVPNQPSAKPAGECPARSSGDRG